MRDKTARGVGWSFIDNIANSGITFLVGLVLARLLTPEEYGVMAMIAIFIAVSDSIIDSGFSNALIRKVDIERIDYNTVFYFNLIVSISLYILLFFVSPAISAFFREPVLVDVMRVIGFVLIVNALAIIPRTIFIRNINFKTQTKVSLIASISSGVVGIGMALSGMGVWSLVGQQLSRQLLNTVFLWGYCKWKPVFEFSAKSFKEMFGFGSKLLVSGLLDTIYKDIYYLVIGRFFTSFVLGQYTRAKQFNTIFSSNLTTVVQRVSYPVLSSIQNEPERLCGAYRKVVNYNSYRREVATCCWLFADYLLFGHALSASCHQSEYPESQRAFGFILEIGNNKKDSCHRSYCIGGIWGDRMYVVG